ncbi:hypothetical protein Tsubulata_003571 [Turnera subulata]|uniref:VQ domain-containing protein n=1 Tax=Turnera subulata TaxID=218843 RepID=A0A9Q0G918_9ROSI|nr:hypothetical protein Tsubulata_003571 [Turnera subulata]
MDHNLLGSSTSSSSFQEERRKATANKARAKKKPMKVVYISNPMKFNTSASGFRALVQELTGQDAVELPADPTKFMAGGAADYHHLHIVGGEGTTTVVAEEGYSSKRSSSSSDDYNDIVQEGSSSAERVDATTFDSLDDILMMPQMLENFSSGALLPSTSTSGLFYEPVSRPCGYVDKL